MQKLFKKKINEKLLPVVYIETTFICDYECKLKKKNTNKKKLKIQTKYITRNAKDTKDFMIVIKKQLVVNSFIKFVFKAMIYNNCFAIITGENENNETM